MSTDDRTLAEWQAERDKRIAAGDIDGWNFDEARITGWVHHAMDRGIDPQVDIPLVSHVEGNLWQGGCKQGIKLPDDFDFVVSLYPWEQYRLGPDTQRWEYRMYDALDQTFEQVDEIANQVVALCAKGKTLVHCQAGLNRSGLLAARALMLMGYTADEAMEKLRESRSPLVLCNEAFEEHLRSL